MSTRSKSKLAAASTSKAATQDTQKQIQKPKATPRKPTKVSLSDSDQLEKENVKVKKPSKTANKKTREAILCTCQRGDDGSPMVYCGQCKIWYHFTCVDLSEKDAEEINVYICPSCTQTSGRRTAMLWEGGAAVEECIDEDPEPTPKVTKKRSSGVKPKQPTPVLLPSESEGEPSSEDEYIAEESKSKGRLGKRPTRRVSVSSESDSDMSDDTNERPQKSAPLNSGRLKRKSHEPSHTPPPKRKKSAESNVTDDPARKYCLGKLEELFRDIFLRYPHLPTENDDGSDAPERVQKPQGDSTEEENAILVNKSKQFATDLESCIYETYAEPDKQGKHSAGPKYKDRFRTLQFNLSKADRVVIHQRIASGLLTPKEISTMSSTDLANEETKQSIKIAEKEALEHSILTPTAVPRAKITHKGLEDIEDIHGEIARSSLDQERARIEEEERRERERMARLTVQRQRTASVSVPPESPITQNHSWGAPPPVPAHAMSIVSADEATSPPSHERSSSVHSTDISIPEPELNLADFINMDDEVPSVIDAGTKALVASPGGSPMTEDSVLPPTAQSSSPPSTSPTTGISPFAAKTESQRLSFNLDALWNAPKNEASSAPQINHEQDFLVRSNAAGDEQKDIMEHEATGADDQDFDMFLIEKDQGASADALQAAFDALPQVWSGKITMPLDSTIPQETPVVARQLGGRHLEHHSALWKTLFPSDLLRIDGRVPVDNSNKFLLHMRMNTSKELIAVAFSPTSESSDVGFRILSDVLIAKGRHGLVFPWGHHPKDHHPGRELYIIPLLSSDPLPDFIELMDNLSLPKSRKVNYLIGIWVLTKGKLAPPPAPPLPPPIVPTVTPNLLPLLNSAGSLPAGPTQAPLPPALAAEVATLTPEQIQLMLQTLTGTGTFPPASTPSQQSHALPPHPPPKSHVAIAPTVLPQPWPNAAQGYGGQYPPSNLQLHPSPPRPHSQYERDFRPGPGYDRYDLGDTGSSRGDRGWRGRGGRGSGRGHESPRKPVDSGWPRRRPQDNGGGAGPPAMPSPRRW